MDGDSGWGFGTKWGPLGTFEAEKSPKNSQVKSRKILNPGDGDLGFLRPKISEKSPIKNFFKSWDFFPGIGDFYSGNRGFLSQGIGNFWKSGGVYLGDSGVLKILGYLSQGLKFSKILGVSSRGFGIFWDEDFLGCRFFSWDWIFHWKATSGLKTHPQKMFRNGMARWNWGV